MPPRKSNNPLKVAGIKGPVNREELEKARARIGPTPVHEVRWLLGLSGLDLRRSSAGDLLNLLYEFLAFCQPLGPRRVKPGVVQLFGLPRGGLNKKSLVDFREDVNGIFEKILRGDYLQFDPPKVTIALLPPGPRDQHPEWTVDFLSDDPQGVALYRLLQIVQPYAHLVRKCPTCRKRFLADRINQEYCSTRCQTRMAVWNFRGTPRDRRGKRGRPRKPRSS